MLPNMGQVSRNHIKPMGNHGCLAKDIQKLSRRHPKGPTWHQKAVSKSSKSHPKVIQTSPESHPNVVQRSPRAIPNAPENSPGGRKPYKTNGKTLFSGYPELIQSDPKVIRIHPKVTHMASKSCFKVIQQSTKRHQKVTRKPT